MTPKLCGITEIAIACSRDPITENEAQAEALRALLAKRLAAAGVDVAVVSPKVPSTVAADLGKISFDAANGVGSIYSPQVTMNAGEVIFDDFAVGASKGLLAMVRTGLPN